MPHRKDLVDDFDDAQRQKLADLMKQFLTDDIVAEHLAVAAGSDVLHPSHEQFFQNSFKIIGPTSPNWKRS